jgi:DNA modification methylase
VFKTWRIVLDLTAGSGSIMSACEQLGRIAERHELELFSSLPCNVILITFIIPKRRIQSDSKSDKSDSTI